MARDTGFSWRTPGYLGKDLFDKLFIKGIHLVTKIRKSI